MSRALKIHWAIWGALVVVVAIGVLGVKLSSPTLVSIKLRPKESTDVVEFRPLPDALQLSLIFKVVGPQLRPELGNWKKDESKSREHPGSIEFYNPGEVVKLLVRGEGREVIYEAFPSNTGDNRDLFPFIDDGNPRLFRWPPELALLPRLPSGYSTFNITILEVGRELMGEQATLVVKSPVSLKRTAPGYDLLWWFIFWPMYLFILVPYGAMLLSMSMRQRRRNNTE